MESHMAPEVLEGLTRARKQAELMSPRLRVVCDGVIYPVLRSWNGSFALSAEHTPHLRGWVEFCDGAKVLHECLIIYSEQDGPEIRYEVKRRQLVDPTQPVDFERPDDAPVALIEGRVTSFRDRKI